MEDRQEPQTARDGATVGPSSWRDHLAAAPAEFAAIVPGLMLCIVITAVAMVSQNWEEAAFGHPYVEALVIAILLGIAVRSFWQPGDIWHAGISFSAKTLLEIAVVLLGASISLGAIVASGPALLSGIVATVVAALAASYATSRALGLPRRVSILIACGNSICGNSAIAAVAPVIGADSDDIASSIAFTAILGVVVVLGLPLFIPLLALTETQYGVLAGLTVYAVPQVLAATVPISAVSAQLGTLVKLVRVLMLGPVVVLVSLFRSRLERRRSCAAAGPDLSYSMVHHRLSRSRSRAKRRIDSARAAGTDRDRRESADGGVDGGARIGCRCASGRPRRRPRHHRGRGLASGAHRDQHCAHSAAADRVMRRSYIRHMTRLPAAVSVPLFRDIELGRQRREALEDAC